MTSSLLFVLSAIRAIVEMLGLCLIAQAAMYLLLGGNRFNNPIYRFFSLLTAAPRKFTAVLLPAGAGQAIVAFVGFIILFFLWLGLAYLRKTI